MDQRAIEKFRVIGACVRLQTITWDDEMKLMDGVPYDIDFKRDLTDVTCDGIPIQSIPIGQLMEPPAPQKREQVDGNGGYIPSDLFEQIDKQLKKERKREEKWRRKRKRDKRSDKEKMRDAIYFFDHF